MSEKEKEKERDTILMAALTKQELVETRANEKLEKQAK